MISWAVAPLAFVAMFTGAFLAMALARSAPEDFLSDNTRDTLKVTVGLTAAMTSLILGFMTTSMRNSYVATEEHVQQYAVSVLATDLELRHFGAAACPARQELGRYVRLLRSETWGRGTAPAPPAGAASGIGGQSEATAQLLRLDEAVRVLAPATDDQRASRSAAIDGVKSLLNQRWKLNRDAQSSIPRLFVVVVICWLALIFFSFGWFAPRNVPGITALVLSSISIAAALFLVVEMGEPFSGPMQIAATPLVDVMHTMESHPCLGTTPPAPAG